jgi:hypothetical protein
LAEGRVFFRFGDAEYFSLTFPDAYTGKACTGWVCDPMESFSKSNPQQIPSLKRGFGLIKGRNKRILVVPLQPQSIFSVLLALDVVF